MLSEGVEGGGNSLLASSDDGECGLSVEVVMCSAGTGRLSAGLEELVGAMVV